jgi:hypothetical protein
MSILKRYITAGYLHLEQTGADHDIWMKRMIDHFGQDVEPRLSEVRQWALVLHNRARGPLPHRKNCWEVMGCGKEEGGRRAKKNCVCPASTEARLHAIHGGMNAGRACWAVDGTLCRSSGPDALATKKPYCLSCTFYRSLLQEEHPHLIVSDDMLLMLLP